MAACLTPFYVDNPNYPFASDERQIPVPCGKCPTCLKRRVSHWSFRLMHELRCHSSAHFYTFTYAPEYCPISQNGFMTLRRRDFQLFLKRLRKVTNGNVKYYCCGEYGTHTRRPHYHAIMFDTVQETVEAYWNYGSVFTGTVSEASVAYVLKYINKGKAVPAHRRDDREPEKALMSKKMGLNFITPAIRSYYLMHPFSLFVTTKDGFRVSMPRYYRDKIFDEFDVLRRNLENRHRLLEIEQAAKDAYISEFGDLDGFYRMKDERRIQCLANFKRNLLSRDF